MLTTEEFDYWCRSLELAQIVRETIQEIRLSEPWRRVGGGRHNVLFVIIVHTCAALSQKDMPITASLVLNNSKQVFSRFDK